MIGKDWSSLRKLMVLGGVSGSKAVEDTAIGNPVQFSTDLAKKLKSLNVNFAPVQSGTGNPSPSNIRPITGWTGFDVSRTGKNLLNVSEESYIAYSWNRFLPNPFMKAGTYNVSCQNQFGGSSEYGCRLCVSNVTDSPEIVGNPLSSWGFGKGTLLTVTVNVTEEQAKGKYLKLEMHSQGATLEGLINAKIQVELGATATGYEPFAGTMIPISWQTEEGEVYGGTLDAMTGVLTIEWVAYSVKLSEMIKTTYADRDGYRKSSIPFAYKIKNKNTQISNLAPYEWNMPDAGAVPHFYAYTPQSGDTLSLYVALPTGVDDETTFEMCAELENPFTIQLDPVVLSTLIGDNVIWSNANGDIEVKYLKKG